MRYSIILFAALTISLQSCGQSPKTDSKTSKTDKTMDTPVKKTEEDPQPGSILCAERKRYREPLQRQALPDKRQGCI